ncbi:type II toxin-antitoxin system RelE family toxin [Ursidibacter arcticus]|uniref:type II toxin-antitoxin system RelE family toxin n=1 Tax=Ursidibacter arcticus TaxID=1524965 RepID=UPI0012F8C425|nr:type II toxin-antitoxin system RelE/ParE family toxin [Ursidibacter arcticus]KAE9534602.1 addiction module toxin RelE [Ursidibacter arcticus]
MTYELEFDPRALKEWQKLDHTIREQFKKKLAEILKCPEIPANKLNGYPNCYKIKLRKVGYRLVYQVQNERITVYVVAIGKRERSEAYNTAKSRLAN